MKLLLSIGFAALLPVCAAAALDADVERTHISKYESTQSPSRRYVALSGVGLADVSPSIRMRVRILLVDLGRVHIEQILPWVRSPYVVIWSPGDVLLVCGSADDPDTTKLYYEASAIQPNASGGLDYRAATAYERSAVVAAFEAKHGFRPSPLVDAQSATPNKPSFLR